MQMNSHSDGSDLPSTSKTRYTDCSRVGPCVQGVEPLEQRQVQPRPDLLPPERLGEVSHQVPVRPHIAAVPVPAGGGGPEREAVVVLGGQHRVPASATNQSQPEQDTTQGVRQRLSR